MTWDGGSPELPPLWGAGHGDDLWAPPASGPDEPLEERHQNIAATLQRRLEEVVLGMLRELHAKTGIDALCMAGGVALNCVVNGKIFDETPFRDLYIQPAAYDGGTSVGAAAYVAHHELGAPRALRDGPRVLGSGVRRRAHEGARWTPPASRTRRCRPRS